MKDIDLVSVIIPSYGGGQFLERTIKSVLDQTYKNIEIIVVDDNGLGTENQIKTSEVMRRFSDFENVFYVCHEVNKNGSAARNTGVNNSHGKYISLLDDDDIFYPEKIERQVEKFNELSSEYGLVYCSTAIFQNGKKVCENIARGSDNFLFDLLIHKENIWSSSLMIKKTIWNKLNGFDESFRRHQDYEFTVRVASVCKIAAIEYVGFQYNLEFRNSPKSAEKAKEFREHYLSKMLPYIQMLTKKQQKKVYVTNRMDYVLYFLKEKRILEFIKEYFSCKLGFYGLGLLVKRFFGYLKRQTKRK